MHAIIKIFLSGIIFFIFTNAMYASANNNTTPDVYTFKSTQQQENFKELMQELRCLVCQNQNLADSNARLAQDLRREVYQMVLNEKNKQEIIDYLLARYGEFVLFKPQLNGHTYVLWFGPFVLLISAFIFFYRWLKRARVCEN
jgi:cytochrome c-type biogenesis protein CcmH